MWAGRSAGQFGFLRRKQGFFGGIQLVACLEDPIQLYTHASQVERDIKKAVLSWVPLFPYSLRAFPCGLSSVLVRLLT